MKKVIARSLGLGLAVLLALMVMALYATAQIPSPKPPEVKKWILATSKEGTFGYATAFGMARIADKYVKGVRLTVVPGYSTTATNTVYDKGECNIAYTNLLSLKEAWRNEGPFAKKPLTNKLYHSFYFFSSVHTVMTTAERTDIKNLHDLVGKKFYPFYTGSGSEVLAKLILGPAGLKIMDKIIERQVGIDEITDAVRNKVMDALWVYTIAGSLISTWQDLELRTDLRVVEPSAAEKEIIKKIPGVAAPSYVDAKVFSKPVGVDTIWGIALLFCQNFGPIEDAETVYQIIKAWDEHRDELVALHKGFEEFKEKGMGLTVAGIDALPEVPVHPGAAKYLKEKGLWKDTWKIGKLHPKP